MALEQCNFRLPKWQHRKIKTMAADDGKTLEGFLQDAINDIFDARVDELEEEGNVLIDFVAHSRTQAKYKQQRSSAEV